jgi:hypothetical protein
MAAAELPPFLNAYGNVSKVLQAIKTAGTPPRFTQDFLAELGFTGGGARPILPLLKRIGLLGSDGAPTPLYTQFRNPTQSGQAMATAIRQGYRKLFSVNEQAQKLGREELEGLLMQITGLEAGSTTLRAIYYTFEALKSFAALDAPADPPANIVVREEKAEPQPPPAPPPFSETPPFLRGEVGMSLGYTINLNLPETDNIAVFNAIFQSLRENLLKR